MPRTLLPPVLVLAACTLRPYDHDTGATDTATTAPSTTTTATTTTTTTATITTSTTSTDPTTTDDTTSPTSTSVSFLGKADGNLLAGMECDIWEEDCPEGQKCMPASLDGDNSWESTICVPIVPDPAQLGEPCTSGPISTGEDTCDEHLKCWNVDPDTEIGECIGTCFGSPDAPACAEPCTTCFVAANGVLALCHDICDPLAPDCCPAQDLCVSNPQGEGFVCVPDASGDEGQAFDPCEYADACDPGLTCNDPAFALECPQDALGCCLPFCDLTAPNTCPGKNQVCTPWYAEGQAPLGYDHVGLCTLPL